MAVNSASVMMEPETVVLYNDPLLLCAEENIQSNCAFVFKTINSDVIANSTLIFDSDIYQIGNDHTETGSAVSTVNIGEEISFHFQKDETNLGNGSNMINFFYKNAPKDQPEFVDINTLTDSGYVEAKDNVQESVIISDDESDVIFVKEYREGKREENTVAVEKKNDTNQQGIRRNPVRKARTNKGRRHLQKEHLLEEDFAFLDEIDEENLVLNKTQFSSSTSSAVSFVTETLKEWPINCYERPEFNSNTNKIEPFDFTIREIQTNQQKKKQRLETTTTAKRKSKKKYFIRKRKPKVKKAEKISVNELQTVVDSTFDLLSGFLKVLSQHGRQNTVCKDGVYDLLKNQTSLMAVINDYDEKEVAKCVSKLLGDS